MIAYVNGILEYVEEDTVVLDVGGVGVNVLVPGSVIDRLPAYGEPVKLYTYTCVREDAFLLYGFLSRNDLNMYKKCITVNGIGPKAGLALLTAMDADDLRYAILSEDKKAISKANGIGARTAERLILELKDKLEIDDSMIQKDIDLYTAGKDINEGTGAKKEALDALVALGYSKADCVKALEKIENADGMDSGTLLKKALKLLF